ncbi:MAG: S-layer homology domain-containing protein [Oscillospiraceae bacterium]|nr:S-layer homology domain-containing protein [Oscillospiraceae bacterium]
MGEKNKGSIKIVAALLMLAIAFSQAPVLAKSDSFYDVGTNDWFYNDVKFVKENGLFQGITEDSFEPNGLMTRAMIITVLARYAGVPTSGGTTWFSAAVEWGIANSITDGTDLEGNVTREQLATLLWRYSKQPTNAGNLSAFSDSLAVSSWAIDATRWAVGGGLISGYPDGHLAPQGNATRAEVSAIISRMRQEIRISGAAPDSTSNQGFNAILASAVEKNAQINALANVIKASETIDFLEYNADFIDADRLAQQLVNLKHEYVTSINGGIGSFSIITENGIKKPLIKAINSGGVRAVHRHELTHFFRTCARKTDRDDIYLWNSYFYDKTTQSFITGDKKTGDDSRYIDCAINGILVNESITCFFANEFDPYGISASYEKQQNVTRVLKNIMGADILRKAYFVDDEWTVILNELLQSGIDYRRLIEIFSRLDKLHGSINDKELVYALIEDLIYIYENYKGANWQNDFRFCRSLDRIAFEISAKDELPNLVKSPKYPSVLEHYSNNKYFGISLLQNSYADLDENIRPIVTRDCPYISTIGDKAFADNTSAIKVTFSKDLQPLVKELKLDKSGQLVR